MNAGSGSRDKHAARDTIEAVLKSRGCDFRIVIPRRARDLPQLAREAAAQRPGILVAAGGDGTLNAVASVAHAQGLPLAVVPMGTFNYYARDLGIPSDTAAATALVTEGVIRQVPVGLVNGKLFLISASIGLYRRLIEQRESAKQRYGRSRVVAMLSGIATLLRRHRPYHLRLTTAERALTLSTLTLFFGRNALQMEQLGLDEAVCVARGELAVLALPEVGRMELLGLMLRGATATLEQAANLGQFCATRIDLERVDGGPRQIRVALDGELTKCTLPLVIESVPHALQVLVPQQPEPRR